METKLNQIETKIEIYSWFSSRANVFHLSMLTPEWGPSNSGDARVGIEHLYRQKVPKNMSGPQH